MAKYILVNRIQIDGIELKAAKEIDDSQHDIVRIAAAGGVLVLLPNAVVEARAEKVRAQQARGRRGDELDLLTATHAEEAASTSFDVEDEGVPVPGGPFTVLNFVGGGVSVSGSGPVAEVNVPVGSAGVQSVFGRTGIVTAQTGDYTAAQVGADPAGTAAGSIAAHEAASDPHPQYLTTVEGNAAYDALGAATSAVAAHVAAPDPHAQYQKESEKGAASGYASLDASSLVPSAQIPVITDAQHGSRAGGSLHPVAVASGAAGFLSGSDKAKLDGIEAGATNTPLSSTAPADVTKAAAAVGVGTTVARADHKHDVSTAAPGSVTYAAAAEGTATSLARSDHVHSVSTPAAPVNVTKAAASAGTATAFARDDHKHDVTTAAPGTTTYGSAAEGTATSLARSDHSHAVSTPAAPVNVTKAAASAGTATAFARDDHKHDVTTAAPVAVGTANAEGTATSLARSDHVHVGDPSQLQWGNDSVTATTTTRYLTPGYEGATARTSPVQINASRAGTARNLRIRHNTTAGNGNSIVYTLRVNGVASTLTVSLASTSAAGSDLTHTVTIAAGDLLDIEVTKAASVATSPSDITATLEFDS